MPFSPAAISPLTLATACETPFPAQASPPSRSSTASNSPVEAPEGTAARPRAPDSSATSTSTVGLPRESRIWRAWIDWIPLTGARSVVPAAEVGLAAGNDAGRQFDAFRQRSFFARRTGPLCQFFAFPFEHAHRSGLGRFFRIRFVAGWIRFRGASVALEVGAAFDLVIVGTESARGPGAVVVAHEA